MDGNMCNHFPAGFQMVPIRHHELNYFTSTFWPKLIHGADMVPFRKTTTPVILIQVPNRHHFIISDFTTALHGRICTYSLYYLRIRAKALAAKQFERSFCWHITMVVSAQQPSQQLELLDTAQHSTPRKTSLWLKDTIPLSERNIYQWHWYDPVR